MKKLGKELEAAQPATRILILYSRSMTGISEAMGEFQRAVQSRVATITNKNKNTELYLKLHEI